MRNVASLLITHRVSGTVAEVFTGFTEQLFLQLAPSFPPTQLLRYDGNQVGDLVTLELGVWPLKQTWTSRITEYNPGEDLSYFVDEGIQLPWPLTFWKHKHIIRAESPGVVAIVEDIEFATIAAPITQFVKPILKAQFQARGPKYSQYFGKVSEI